MNIGVFNQSILSLLDDADNTSSILPSPIGPLPFPLPGEPIETLSGDTTSIHSGVTELSFGPSGSPLSKCNSEFGFSAGEGDLGYKEFASHDSFNYSVIDAFPSSLSIDRAPPIPSIALDLNLHNFPTLDGRSLEPHSVYFSAVEGDLSMSLRSYDGPGPVHETSASSESALDLCIPTAEEAHHQIFWQENPSPRRPTVRIEVRNDVLRPEEQGAIRRESFTYACKSLPYDAGFRPHAYVDNHESATHGKHHLEALEEDLYTMEEFMEEEDHVRADKPKRPTIFRKLVGGKRMSKLMALGPLMFHKTPKTFSVHPCSADPQSLAAFSSMRNFADRSPVTTNHPDGPNYPPILPPSSPPSSPIPNKKRTRDIFRKTWSGSQPLSMFVVPKPKVEGRVAPSPRELPMDLPAGENPPPFSPPTSPQLDSTQIPETDVHGRTYGPSRVASPDLLPRSLDLPVLGRKERRSWLPNIRSPKNSPLVV